MRYRSESGAILIQVGLLLLVLLAFLGFVIDEGVRWVARRQAQNAADAGALAGAIARAFDETADPPERAGATVASIQAVTAKNAILGDTTQAVRWSWACPPFVDAGARCARVEIYRDGTDGSPRLPTFFMQAVGVTDQNTRAVATAQARPANATECLRPFAIPDQWSEVNRPPSPETFNRYRTSGPGRGTLLPNPDVYRAPSLNDTGTGYTVADNYGEEFVLAFGPGGGEQRRGWYQPVDLPRADDAPMSGAARLRENIVSCNGLPVERGDYLPTESGAQVGPIRQGIRDLIAQDPSADWDPGSAAVINSCVPGCGAFSPRIITLPMYDVDAFQYSQATNNWRACPTGGSCIKITNFIGFFVDRVEGNDVIGYLMRAPGSLARNAQEVGWNSG